MALDKNDVEKIAHLARLQINDSDIVEVAQRISNILGMIDQMQSVDTSAVSAMAHPLMQVSVCAQIRSRKPTSAIITRS